jgi:hypothetical protein
VPDAVVVGLVSGILGSSATAVATLLAVRWTMEGQRQLDREARESARRALAVDRRRAAFRELLVGAHHVYDAARELRMYPRGRPRTDTDPKDYDPYALVNAALADSNAAYRAAEPDLLLDLGPKADRILKSFDELMRNFHGYRVLLMGSTPPEQLQSAFESIEGSMAKLRGETHLELPGPGTDGPG